MNSPSFEVHKTGKGEQIVFSGSWVVSLVADVDKGLARLRPASGTKVLIDVSAITGMDTAGAWLVERTVRACRHAGAGVEIIGASEKHQILLNRVRPEEDEKAASKKPLFFLEILENVGRKVCHVFSEAWALFGFFGFFLFVTARTVLKPWRLRLTSLVYHMEQVGFDAVPIVSLISFLIGIVLAYMGAQQLSQFGAQVFVVNLIEAATLRELGILLTAIVIAGRSGSSFTASLGSMMINQEVDAMRAMGLDPMEVLVLPRVLALLFMLPILCLVADFMGIFGGGLMSWAVLDISPGVFVERLRVVFSPWNFWIGVIKAPFFAMSIGLIGCFCGFQVKGSAESVGRLTTQSVVESIFTVIVLDAAFAIFFSALGV